MSLSRMVGRGMDGKALVRPKRYIKIDISPDLYKSFVIKSKTNQTKPVVNTESMFLRLPTEILLEVIGYLPGSDIWNLQSVCTRLRDVILHFELAIVLEPEQEEHFKNCIEILKKNRCLIDNSDRGAGKSVITSFLSRDTKRSLTYVTEKTPGPQIKEIALAVGNKDVEILSYPALRRSNKYFEFKKVSKVSKKTGSHRQKVVCVPTALWIERCKKGTLLCFDEAQALKNNTAQFKGALCMAREAYRHERSVVELTSATLTDKPETIGNFCKLLNLIQAEKLAVFDVQRGYILKGAKELFDNCKSKFGMPDAEYNLSLINFRKAKHRLMTEVFSKYVLPSLYAAMPPIVYDVETINMFYDLAKKDSDLVGESVEKMRRILQQLQQNPSLNNQVRSMLAGAINLSEAGKIARVAMAIAVLLDSTKEKVVIAMNGTQNIDRMAKLTEMYGSVVVDGRVSLAARTKRISQFQRHDDSCRVFIGNIKCIAMGISLHDTGKGEDSRPRRMFIFPSFNGMHMHQAAARITRRFMTSKAHVEYVYAKGHDQEMHILEAISRRDATRRQLTHEKNSKVLYPSEHTRVYE